MKDQFGNNFSPGSANQINVEVEEDVTGEALSQEEVPDYPGWDGTTTGGSVSGSGLNNDEQLRQSDPWPDSGTYYWKQKVRVKGTSGDGTEKKWKWTYYPWSDQKGEHGEW